MKTALLVLSLLFVVPSHAADFRHWIARVGAHPIQPRSNSHSQFRLDDAAALSAGLTYLMAEHWGVELFATAPAQLTLYRLDGEAVARTDLIPITTSLQYHIVDAGERMRVYGGVGVVYAMFRDERTFASLGAQSMDLDSGAGASAHVGLDLNLGAKWFASIDARWFDIDAPLTIGGTGVGQLRMDPFAFGLSIGRRLR